MSDWPFARRAGARVVVGAGGHAKVVLAALDAAGTPADAVLDDNPTRWGTLLFGVPVLGAVAALSSWPGVRVVLAIGNNRRRKEIAETYTDIEWLTVVHPSAIVHSSATLAPGAMVMWRAVVEPDARIGAHAIVNTGAAVCHDAVVGDYAHISVTSTLAGEARVGEGCFIGMNACVIGGAPVGAWSIIGAGASVVHAIPAGVTAVGVPARVVSVRAG